jgi:hypothetical protein
MKYGATVRLVIRAAVAAAVNAAAWSWRTIRGAGALIRPRSGAPDRKLAETRRRYVFGAINRDAFDAATRKRRRRLLSK